MLFGEIISVALGALRANKLRSLLTVLSITIGAFESMMAPYRLPASFRLSSAWRIGWVPAVRSTEYAAG